MNVDRTVVMYLAGLSNRGSRSLPAAGLLTVLLLALAQACTPAGKPATGHTLGVYGDWTAYQLEDGGLQVCYVETGLISVPGAEPDFSEVRLQVSNRAFNPGTDLIRFTSTHVLPHDNAGTLQLIEVGLVPISVYGLAGLLTPEEYDNGGPFDDELVDEMKSGEITEVALTQYQNWEDYRADKNGARLGSYSMAGFIEAYEVISRACPLRPERPARADVLPVRIDGYATVEGPPAYHTFSLTGPFFEAGKADTLTIRGIPWRGQSDFDHLEEERAEISPETYFVFDSYSWEFYRNGVQVDSFGLGSRYEINGVCLNPETERLKLLIYAWGDRLSMFYEPGKGVHTDRHYAIDAFGPGLVECRDDESRMERDRPFRPCLCSGSAGNRLYHTTLEQLRSDIRRAASTDEDTRPRTIDDDTFNALLSSASRLEPFIWWDAYSHLDVQRFESPNYAVVSLTFQDRTSVYGSFQQVFVRRLSEDVWTRVHSIGGNQKSFNSAEIHGFIDGDTLDITMCVEDCDWWGRHERVRQNVHEWLQEADSAE